MTEEQYRKAVVNRLTIFLAVMGIFSALLVGHNIMVMPTLNAVDKKVSEIQQNLNDLVPNN